MPDDDYEETIPDRLWIDFATNNKLKNARKIRRLLDLTDEHIVVQKEDNFAIYAAIRNLTKVLRLMNGIE